MKLLSFLFLINIFTNAYDIHKPNWIKFRSSQLHAYDPKEEARQEQMRIQQEMLARRKNKTTMKKYFEDVEERRKETGKIASRNNWRNEKDSIDPIDNWRKSLEKGTDILIN